MRVGEQTQHESLAVLNWKGRETHVVVAAGDFEPNATVLREAFFGDIELAHDLDTRRDAGLERARQGLHRLVQNVIDAEAYADLPFEGLDVDIACTLLDGVLEHRVHQPNDRCVVGGFEQVLRFATNLKCQFVEVVGGFFGELIRRGCAAIKYAVDGGENDAIAGKFEHDFRAVEQDAQVVEGSHCQRVRRNDDNGAEVRVPADGEHSVLLRVTDRELQRVLVVDLFNRERAAKREVELSRECTQHFICIEHALVDEDVGKSLSALGLTLARALELSGLKPRGVQQDLAKF